jgi:aspartate racemase
MTQPQEKRIGIIAGSGPEAGIDLWMKILKANKAKMGKKFKGDQDAPHVVIHSVPELGLSMDIDQYKEEVRRSLLDTVGKIAKEAGLLAIACNTLHYYSRDIHREISQLKLNVEFVSIVDAVTHYIKSNNIKQVALLGSKYGMDLGKEGIYTPVLGVADIELPTDLNDVHQLVYDIKRLGPDDDAVKYKFMSIISRLNSKHILLACTELPLVKPKLDGIHFIDGTDLLAQELVEKIYQKKNL